MELEYWIPHVIDPGKVNLVVSTIHKTKARTSGTGDGEHTGIVYYSLHANM